MTMSRREFVKAAAVSSIAAPAFGALPSFGTRNPLKILILGGTGFLGPAVVEAAKARGHALTLFNRGKTEKRIGTIDGVEKLFGNRDPNLHSEESDPSSPLGLSQIEEAIKGGARWDAIVDTSGYFPRIVDASAQLLSKAAKSYIFISTISVYAANSIVDTDETAPVGTLVNPAVENMGAQSENYGPLKALCEQAAEKAFPGRTANIRPGFIVGPGDPTDRFTYWVARAARGGEILAPGAAADPVQYIDVRDLAEFVIRCAEQSTAGTFNLIGPPTPMPWGELLGACVAAAKGSPASTLTWVPTSFIIEQGLSPGGDLPIWVPPEGESGGFHRRSTARATAAGLKLRTPLDTCSATLAWWPKELERRARVTKQILEDAQKTGKPAPRVADPSALRAGLTAEREAQVLAAWHASQEPAGQAPAPKAPAGQ